MPGKVKVKVLAGRNLPIMDRGSLTTDAYVEVKLGSVCHKTEVARKTLNPQWNSDWFRFEVDDAELQDEPLQIRIMDYDTYSANDVIGKVYLSLNPLLLPSSLVHDSQKNGKGSVMSGWLPVFDTLQGIRGEINVIVKVDLFSDVNKFRQSSCGINFFCSPCTPIGFNLQVIHGFVEELLVNDDPEYQWIDKIRTPRASNEARQVAFLKLSGQVQRKIGLKAIEMGANSVIAYKLSFDLENDIGVVARGTGTAVTITKTQEGQPAYAENTLFEDDNTTKHSNSMLRISSEQTLNKTTSRLSSHAYSSGDIPISADQQNIQILLEQEDNRLPEEKGKGYGWKIKPKIFFKKHLKNQRRKNDGLMAHSFSDLKTTIKGSLIDLRIISKKKQKSIASNMTNVLVQSVISSPMDLLDKIIEDDTFIEQKNIPESTRSTSSLSTTSISSESFSTLSTGEYYEEEHSKLATNSNLSCNASETISMIVNSIDTDEKNQTLRASLSDTRLNDELFKSIPMGKFEVVKDCKGHVISDPFIVTCNTKQDDIKKLLENPNEEMCDWIQPGSTIIPESETQHVPQHFSMQNLSDTIHHLQNQILMPFHEPSGIIYHHDHPGLLQTAIATMLIEKLNICEASAGILPNAVVETPSVYECCIKDKTMGLSSKINSFMRGNSEPCLITQKDNDIIKAQVQCSSCKVHNNSLLKKFETKIHDFDSHKTEFKTKFSRKLHRFQEICHIPFRAVSERKQHSLLNTAMQTILLDRANFMETQTGLIVAPNSEEGQNLSLIDKRKQLVSQKKDNTISVELLRNKTDRFYIGENDLQRTEKCSSEDNAEIDSSKFNVLSLVTPPTIKLFSSRQIENIDKADYNMLQTTNEKSLNITNQPSLHASSSFTFRNEANTTPFHQRTESISSNVRPQPTISNSTGRETPNLAMHHRRSSDSDLSITPKGNSLNSGDKSTSAIPKTPLLRSTLVQDNLLEYPFLTINKFPAGFILHLGATVAARSVKLLERIPNPDEPETRDSWWNELRMEIRSHARAIGCNVVLGYSELTTITDDVCVLSATGTAAIVNFSYMSEPVTMDNTVSSKKDNIYGSSLEKREALTEKTSDSENEANIYRREHTNNPTITLAPGILLAQSDCSICHIPYSINSLPFKTNMSKCTVCKRCKVPDVLLATIELPELIPITGRACLIQAHVCRYKRDLKSEANAKEISDGLPFLEYELHRQLICKLKVKGMNAIFGLKVSLAVGDRLMALVATGTAVFVSCLPSPKVPKIVAGNSWTDSGKLDELQKTVQETQERNKDIFQIKVYQECEMTSKPFVLDIDDTDTDDENILADLTLANKDSCVLEVDDIQDLALVSLIMECNPPDGIYVVNTEYLPGLQDLEVAKHLQMFSQVWRAKIPANQPNSSFSKHFQRLLQTIYFKLRTLRPCVIVGLKFLIDLPEADEMQILVTGMAYSFCEPKGKFKKRMVSHSVSKDGVRRLDDDLIFNLEEDVDLSEQQPNVLHTGSLRLRKKSPTRAKNKAGRHVPLRERYGVDITPLSMLPGLHVEKYLGNLNFFFIRESTSIRENGGISGFVHSFITEILAIVRAHVSCLGGNAIVSFYMTELMLVDNPNKNQGQCLISVGGDVVFVSDLFEE